MSDTTRSNPDAPTGADPAEARKGRRRGAIPTPHDKLFRSVFSDPAHSRPLVRDQLPNEIAGLLADTSPRVVPGTFIDSDMGETQADLLLEVDLVDGGSAFVYVLVEHKSYPDAEVVLQVLGYMVRVWRDYVRKGKGREGRAARAQNLPPIIPLLGYSGSRAWTGPTDLADMIATDTPELVFLHGPDLILRQWAQMAPEELSSDPVAKAGLLTLTQRGLEHLDEIDAALADNPSLQAQFAVYIRQTAQGAALEELERKLAAARAGQTEGILGTIMEELRAEGEAKGEARGIAKGEAMGLAKGRKQDLIRLLERRFGALSEADRARIEGAGLDQLDAWIDRVLDAKSLKAVFGDG
ncbi:Rpn family recombination-promoting nuclease/putative transposase [Ruegeria sp.]|uniref:Rpn family recombination-promoting nuclease/putative transposase n=1 Tax=Ruegeria sp. TaxID=1879320 RepID=UPI003B594613